MLGLRAASPACNRRAKGDRPTQFYDRKELLALAAAAASRGPVAVIGPIYSAEDGFSAIDLVGSEGGQPFRDVIRAKGRRVVVALRAALIERLSAEDAIAVEIADNQDELEQLVALRGLQALPVYARQHDRQPSLSARGLRLCSGCCAILRKEEFGHRAVCPECYRRSLEAARLHRARARLVAVIKARFERPVCGSLTVQLVNPKGRFRLRSHAATIITAAGDGELAPATATVEASQTAPAFVVTWAPAPMKSYVKPAGWHRHHRRSAAISAEMAPMTAIAIATSTIEEPMTAPPARMDATKPLDDATKSATVADFGTQLIAALGLVHPTMIASLAPHIVIEDAGDVIRLEVHQVDAIVTVDMDSAAALALASRIIAAVASRLPAKSPADAPGRGFAANGQSHVVPAIALSGASGAAGARRLVV